MLPFQDLLVDLRQAGIYIQGASNDRRLDYLQLAGIIVEYETRILRVSAERRGNIQ